ncbi:MFS transporter [Amycolatopsis japonica]|uniref:MFS transporter n=1 Tax=Amycolatopsis japonica TaxID=208439 RepID=UPI00367287D1
MVAVITAAPRTGTVFAGFAAYGALWGPYLSMLPDVRNATGAGEAQLGAALLIGALAAMPAMFAIGRLLDRFGRPVAVSTFAGFALIAPTPALAGSVPALFLTLGLFGFGSGACNVVVVALAASAEAGDGPRVMNRAHALFSIGLLTCSLGTGAARTAGVPAEAIALTLSALVVLGAIAARNSVPGRLVRQGREPGRRLRLGPAVLLLCLLAALAMVVESGVQQWSAVFLADITRAPVGISAAAPGIFAAGMALGRFGGHWLSGRASDRLVLLTSGALSGVGVLMLSMADAPVHGLLGTAVVGGAISVSTPTVYGLIGRGASAEDRGAVIGSAASLASVGLLLGPAVVGQIAGRTDLRVAIAALSVASVAVCLLALRVPARNQ